MAVFQVLWNRPDSSDDSTQQLIISDVPTMAHAAWEAAEQVFDCTHPSGRQLLDVIRLS